MKLDLEDYIKITVIELSFYSDHGPKESTKASAPAFTFGGKSDIKNKFKTPAPNAYDTEKGEDYLDVTVKQLSMGERLKEAKKFLTPAPNKYEVGVIFL